MKSRMKLLSSIAIVGIAIASLVTYVYIMHRNDERPECC